MWPDCLDEPRQILGGFTGSVPALENLTLVQMVLEHGDLHLSFDFPAMPDGYPARWHEKQYDRLQLRLTLYRVEAIDMHGNIEELDHLSAMLQPNAFTVLRSDKSPLISARFYRAGANWHPYHDSAHGPAMWHTV